MFVKSVGNKSRGAIAPLLTYIQKEGAMKDKQGQVILLKHNITGATLEELEEFFLKNEANRRYPRKGVNVIYHDWISFHPDDSAGLDAETLEKIGREYLKLRGEACVAVFTFHEDTDHKHIHLLIGGVRYGSGLSIRVSKDYFQKEIKERLQEFQIQNDIAPNSIVRHGQGIEQEMSDEEYQLKQRTGKPSRRDEIKAKLEQAYDDSLSPEEFYEKAKTEQGLNLYERGGSVAGVDDNNRHFRFFGLGFGEPKMTELRRRAERMTLLQGDEMREYEKEEVEIDEKESEEITMEDKTIEQAQKD